MLVERYAGVREFFDRPPETVEATTQCLSWSIAKSILHLILGTLVDDGHLDPDQPAPVADWRDESDPRHAIRFAICCPCATDSASSRSTGSARPSDVIEMLCGEGKDDMAGFTARVAARPRAGHVLQLLERHDQHPQPHRRRDLVGYGDAIARTSKTPLRAPRHDECRSDVRRERRLRCLDFVHATALDFAKFGLLYLRGGEWDGRHSSRASGSTPPRCR